jgi:hypothetical protein
MRVICLTVEKHHLCIPHATLTRNAVLIYQCFLARNVVFMYFLKQFN